MHPTSWDIPTQRTRTLFLPFTSLKHIQIWLKYHALPTLHSLGSCLKGQGRRQQGSHSSIPFYDIGSKRTHGLLRWSHCRCRSRQACLLSSWLLKPLFVISLFLCKNTTFRNNSLWCIAEKLYFCITAAALQLLKTLLHGGSTFQNNMKNSWQSITI